MGKEKVLVNAHYEVVTFRGYQYCETANAASKAAKEMIQGIVDDKWDSSFWWARVIDLNSSTSMIVYRLIGGGFRFTNWLTLR